MNITRQIMHSAIRLAMVSILVTALNAISIPAHAAFGYLFIVNSTVTAASDHKCSLEEAITASNTSSPSPNDCPSSGSRSINTIDFNIPNSDLNYSAGIFTITLTTNLDVTHPVIIDGTSQTGCSSVPCVHLNHTTTSFDLLTLDTGSDGSTVKGLMFSNTVNKVDLLIKLASGMTVQSNYFDTDGTTLQGSSVVGVDISSSSNNLIGGPLASERNLFGDTGQYGVYVQDSSTKGNTIQGNYFGVQADGLTAITGQSTSGTAVVVYATSSSNANNVVRSNLITKFDTGIWVTAGATNTIIAGNIFGLGKDGSTPLGGIGNGISISGITGGSSNIVGGLTAADRNVISEYQDGINISGASNNNVVEGNYIGTNASGSSAKPNSYGISITGGDGNMIGGTVAGSGNLISGNTTEGLFIETTSTNTQVFGNRVGTNAAGLVAIPNPGDAIRVMDTSAVIGSSTTPGNNLISGNGDGILIQNGSGTTVFGNRIGVNLPGSGALPNTFEGIYVGNASAQIGNNWIANNPSGVFVDGLSSIVAPSANNCITGNTNFGVENGGTVSVDFTNNWWGSETGPTYAGNIGGTGDKISDHVDYSPVLAHTADICSPVVSVNSGSLNFGNQLVGSSSALKTLTLTNIGGKLMHLTSITSTSPFSRDASSTCPAGIGNLLPGASCTIKIKFSPTATGLVTHNLTITSDASTSPNHVTLKGTGIAGTPLLKNPGFEIDANHDKKPDNWSFTNFNIASDRRDCTVNKNGVCSLKLAGNGLQKVGSQSITKSGIAGDDFTFSLWSKAGSIPTSSIYRLQVLFYKGSVVKGNISKNFAIGSHPFQKASGTFTAPTAYTKIVFKIIFKANSGTAWFDTAGLNWAP